jgi:glycosyltransferase involved in cell wall biosynthesis
MNYDVVIATKNRPEALKISIPLILNQSILPETLIVVDSSDDHGLIRKTVEEIVRDKVQLVIVRTMPNLPQQRNIGLKHVESSIVIFPDDDSLWWSGVAEAILRIYQRDKKSEIGGVCATWATEPPPQANISDRRKYRMTRTDRIKQKIGGWRHRFEDFVCPNPMYVHGRTQWSHLAIPQWLSDVNAVQIEYMNGLCMTFRTEVIRKHGFDADLGSYVGWAPCEDVAASFAVMQELPVVRACDAMVCHYTFPSLRSTGFRVGFVTQLNRAYVLCRYAAPSSPARKALRRFAYYKMIQYSLGCHSKYGRERLYGHIKAISATKVFLNLPVDALRDSYLETSQQFLSDGHA